ncbi:hypothetical protein [Solidesulfovibrio aerotolerans]|uniref:hypothetical protein n=1 Tax=Solidesulfovibrio aerotolerans TaxID=295255 RepID=UPI00147855D5|nr:hypothetical protein [Solidesulfovibrio aerotolerans]
MKKGVSHIIHQRHIDADVEINDHQHADDPQNLNGIHHKQVPDGKDIAGLKRVWIGLGGMPASVLPLRPGRADGHGFLAVFAGRVNSAKG